MLGTLLASGCLTPLAGAPGADSESGVELPATQVLEEGLAQTARLLAFSDRS